MEPTSTIALGMAAAVRVARRLELVDAHVEVRPEVLHIGANAVVHLAPVPIVARVAFWTASVREEPGRHLGLEVALTRRAAAAGADVVVPLEGEAGGPHDEPEGVLTLWPLLTELRSERGGVAAGESLARLHSALRGYDGWMPGPENVALDSKRAVQMLARLGAMSASEAAEIGKQSFTALDEMRSVMARLEREQPGRMVPLHGDPHGGNLLVRDGRATWWDLDDAWRGPVEWDLVVARDSEQLEGGDPLAAYCAATDFVPDADAMVASRRLRDAQGRAWSALYGYGRSLSQP
jgi:hypothetical protein